MTAPSVIRRELWFLLNTFLICCFGVLGILETRYYQIGFETNSKLTNRYVEC